MTARINQLKWLLVDAIYDLVTPATVYREYQSNSGFDPAAPKYLGVCRMCNSHAIIALAKLDEAINHFGKEIKDFPEVLRADVYKIKKQIEAKGVYKFRSRYVAHAFNGEGNSKAPLHISEGYQMLTNITGPRLDEFYCWICPEENHESDNSFGVVPVVVKMRDHCLVISGSGRERP